MPSEYSAARLAARSPSWEQLVGLAVVVAAHALVLYGLWTYRLLPTPVQVTTLFVDLINPTPPAPPHKEEPPQPPKEVTRAKPRPLIKRKPRQLAVEAPALTPSEPVVPEPPPQPAPVIEAPPAPPPEPAGPVNLGEALAVVCPERTPPTYPAQARRLGEQGKVVLRVELDEQGRVMAARVHRSSGSTRLDEAALGAVRQWRCTPARRNGLAVRASALQPFNFILEGN